MGDRKRPRTTDEQGHEHGTAPNATERRREADKAADEGGFGINGGTERPGDKPYER